MPQSDAIEILRARLIERIQRYTPHDGSFAMRLPGLSLYRFDRPTGDLHHGIQRPGLCLIAQGSKTVRLDRESFRNDEHSLMIYSADVPVGSCLAGTSDGEPHLSLGLDLDPVRLSELVPRVYPHGVARAQEGRAVAVMHTEEGILAAAVRLMELMGSASDALLLAPLAVDEILLRLLRGPLGLRVAQLGADDSRLSRVNRAIAWLREHFAEPMEVEDLANLVGMSLSTFHQHFKAVTAMSPLQYQKVLRLQEARRLLVANAADAGLAARRVGYASPSQFSREYSRHFGASPLKDVARLRLAAEAVI